MTAFRFALAMAAAALPAGAAAASSLQDGEDDRTICVTIAHNWRGSIAETRAIRSMPVPESFRRPFHGGGCERFQLVLASLVAWHLAYGDEATTTAALAFLEADLRAGAPSPAAFPGVLAAARRDAEPAISAATPGLADTTGAENRRAEREFGRNPGIVRLRALLLVQANYMFLARQYLRAADFHGSRLLYEKARTYFDAARQGFRTIYGERAPMADAIGPVESRLGLWTHHINEMRALDIGMALFQARLTRAPADIDAAGRLLDHYHDEVLRQAGDRVLEGHDICDLGDRTDLGALAAACQDENNLAARAAAYWVGQARLDLLMAADPAGYGLVTAWRGGTGSNYARRDGGAAVQSVWEWPQLRAFQRATRLVAQGRVEVIPETGRRYGEADDAQVSLLLQRADLYARLAAAIPATREGRDGQSAYLAQSLFDAALFDLASAGRIAMPAEMPGRFRQIATLYLAIEAGARARSRAESGDRAQPNSDHARTAAYMRRTLAGLDAIALGEAE